MTSGEPSEREQAQHALAATYSSLEELLVVLRAIGGET